VDALQLAKSPAGDPPSSSSVAEKEAALAWSKYLKLNDSVITDIFAGQLQSTIECLTCHHR
jgi:ubiquitin C-terminal hydrolase